MVTLEQIEQWAGGLRKQTWRHAAQILLKHQGFTNFVETGCFRGNAADGQSTLILAAIAKANGGHVTSYELNPSHIREAQNLLMTHELIEYVDFIQGDSVANLAKREERIDFAYLDSFDFWPDKPEPSQYHALTELLLCLPHLSDNAMVLIDDYDLKHQGKAGMIIPVAQRVLKFKPMAMGYQLLYGIGIA